MASSVNEKIVFKTSGDGLWNDIVKEVNVTNMEVTFFDDLSDEEDPCDLGELRVYFDSSWDVKQDGLIYTDEGFLKGLIEFFANMDIHGNIGYSEQGMQGSNYVSLDVDKKFFEDYTRVLKFIPE